jgi:hypothetical protein
MRKSLLVLAGLLMMGTLAVAQTYGQSQSTVPAMTSMQSNDAAMDQQKSDNAVSVGQTDLNSPNFTHENFQGTILEKAYQQEERSGWQDPNLTKSSPTNATN